MNIGAFDALELQYSTMKEVSEYVKTKLKPEQIARLKQLIKLITGFQSALSLEVLASVAYVRKENPCIDLMQTISKIQEWSPRKKHLFKEKYIQIAYNYLDAFSQGKDELFRTCQLLCFKNTFAIFIGKSHKNVIPLHCSKLNGQTLG